MAEKLLPCPFCGGRAERVDIEDGENAGGSCISCTKCQASSNVEFEFKENFVSNWNRRTTRRRVMAETPIVSVQDIESAKTAAGGWTRETLAAWGVPWPPPKGWKEALTGKVRCGDCQYFIRDGKCDFLATPEGRDPNRKFSHAPFWVWSDCYSDKEQVRADVTSACPVFSAKAITKPGAKPGAKP